MAKNARRKRKCKKKKKYATQTDAVRELVKIKRANPLDGGIHSYKCPFCGGQWWHLGHRFNGRGK